MEAVSLPNPANTQYYNFKYYIVSDIGIHFKYEHGKKGNNKKCSKG